MTSNRIITCKRCGDTNRHGAHGWCHACYMRWQRAGRPESGPPERANPLTALEYARQVHSERADGRREDYHDLRSWGVKRGHAAERLGVSERTVWRYEAALRSQGVA